MAWEIEYGDDIYVAGKHEPDCLSQQPGEVHGDGNTITFTGYICTGCLPKHPA